MNHGARFWAEVERVIPDYRERRAQLKELQRKLIRIAPAFRVLV